MLSILRYIIRKLDRSHELTEPTINVIQYPDMLTVATYHTINRKYGMRGLEVSSLPLLATPVEIGAAILKHLSLCTDLTEEPGQNAKKEIDENYKNITGLSIDKQMESSKLVAVRLTRRHLVFIPSVNKGNHGEVRGYLYTRKAAIKIPNNSHAKTIGENLLSTLSKCTIESETI